MFLTYPARRGHALIDRARYLPRSWIEDAERCHKAGVPDGAEFATKPALATAMITRAVQAGVPAAWVAGDKVYGANPLLRNAIRDHRLGYALQIAANRRVPTHAGPIRVDELATTAPVSAWQQYSCGPGSKGPRYYHWAQIALLAEDDEERDGAHHLLIRRTPGTGELAYLRCYPRTKCRRPPWCAWPRNAGASKNPSKQRRDSSAWTSIKSAAGPHSTAGAPSRCSPTPFSPSPPPSNAITHRHPPP